MTKKCSLCNKEKPLTDFTSRKKTHFHSYCKPCLYNLQKKRWIRRKIDAVMEKGGRCCKCQYGDNLSALHFHHINDNKEFNWNKLRFLSKKVMDSELAKCILVCGNCHAEIHNPQLNRTKWNNFTPPKKLTKSKREPTPTGKCSNCNADVYGNKFCSFLCSALYKRKVKNRPTIDELRLLLSKNSYCAIGKQYGVSDNTVRKWAVLYGIISKSKNTEPIALNPTELQERVSQSP